MDGEIWAWTEQEAIHMPACDINYLDPVELAAQHAQQLANTLIEFADLIVR